MALTELQDYQNQLKSTANPEVRTALQNQINRLTGAQGTAPTAGQSVNPVVQSNPAYPTTVSTPTTQSAPTTKGQTSPTPTKEISQNQYDYLTNLIKGGGGNAIWAQNQLKGVSKPSSLMPGDYTTQSGTPFHNEGNVHVQTETGEQLTDVPTYQGASIAPLNEMQQMLGIQVTKDPNSSTYTIGGKHFSPVGFDAQGNPLFGVRNIGESLGYNVGWDPKSQMVSLSKPQQQQPTSYGSYMDTIANSQPSMPQLTPYQPPDLSGYQSQLTPYQQFNPDMNSYYNQAQSQLDPQYQAQVDKLNALQTQNLKSQDESMNHRGIYTSGIAEAAANDLRAKTTDSIANIFLQEQGAVQKAAQQLYDNAYKQYQDGNQFALKNNEFLMQQMMNERKQAFDQWLKTQNLTMDQYKYALDSWDKMSQFIQNDAKMQFDQFKFNNLSADQTATLQKNYDQMSQDWQKAILPYENMTQYQQAQMDEKQTVDQLDAYFKQEGINIDRAKLEEMVRSNKAKEAATQQKLQADINHWANQDQLKASQIGLDQQKLAEKANYDDQMIAKAQNAAVDSMKRVQLEGYRSELSNITQQINSYIVAGKEAPTNLVDNYNNIMNKVDSVVSAGGSTGSSGTYNPGGN